MVLTMSFEPKDLSAYALPVKITPRVKTLQPPNMDSRVPL